MSAAVVALCRAGFEPEAELDLARVAHDAGFRLDITATRGAGSVVARSEHLDHATWRRAILAHPPIFVRSLFVGSGPHTIVVQDHGRPDRIAPLAEAFAALSRHAAHRPPWRAPWIEYADTNEGKAMSTLARALDARLAGAMHERGLVADLAHAQAHVHLRDGATAWVGTSDERTGSPWPLGIPRLRMPRGAPSRSTLKLAEAIAVFLGDREPDLLHAGQSAVDLGAAPGGWTAQLLARGLQVTAVDNGALAPSLARDPNVEHVRADGLAWRPRRPVDWMVCDIVERPSRIASLVGDWIASETAASAIFNLKLPMKKRYDEVERCADMIRERLAAAGVDATLAFRQLYHDREEVTGYLARNFPRQSSGRMPRRR
ncbi:MAG: 23S rRNA (cytidine(2498)-2'-O)-methyltransferase RlmM [Betaproteobacteria bacterium]